MCCLRTPESASGPGGQDARKARQSGCVSLLTFFAQAKKVSRSPGRRAEQLRMRSERAEVQDSSFRRNDEPKERNWMTIHPAETSTYGYLAPTTRTGNGTLHTSIYPAGNL